MVLILSRTDLEALLPMVDVIGAVEAGFREYAGGRCRVPVRLPLDVPDRNALVLFMPAYLPESGTLGTKIVSVYPDNPARGLPTITGSYLLADAATGELLALMDATYLTAIRTAAASALATRLLARPDARVLGIFGAGVQARFHVWALRTVARIDEVVVFNRTPARAHGFADDMTAAHGIPVRVAATPDECARSADLIATCTRSAVPVFDGHALRPGTHINAVGAYTPEMRELDEETVIRAKVVVDTYAGAMAEAGDLLIPIRQGRMTEAHIHAELSELVIGKKTGRESADEITVFKSVGFAVEDAVTARLAYERAVRQGVGVQVRL